MKKSIEILFAFCYYIQAFVNGMQHNLAVHLVWDQRVAGSNPVIPTIVCGVIAQLGEHLPCTQGVRGSIPLGSTIFLFFVAEQLSWLEHPVHTRQVVGSSPISATIYIWTLSSVGQSSRLITGRSQVRVLQGPPLNNWRNTQVVEGSGLENRQGLRGPPGFESLFLRQS